MTEKTVKFRDEDYGKREDWSNLDWINEFYLFLQGESPEEINCSKEYQPKLSKEKSFSTIWYLQEHLKVLPNNIECCDKCGSLFDISLEGIYCEDNHSHYCEGCEYEEDKQ